MTNLQTYTVALFALAGCDVLGPRASDVALDAPVTAEPDASAPSQILPAGSAVPSINDRAELASQIQIFDGLDDGALAANGGVIMRSIGKAANPADPTGPGLAVMFWNFGPAPMQGTFAVKAALYILADESGDGTFTPRADHPYLIDYIPGDAGYSAVRQIFYVPVTAQYAGQLLTSMGALAEAIDRGLVKEPIAASAWRNMPVVPTGTKLEVDTSVAAAATEVFGVGYRVELFVLGTGFAPQPLRNNLVPIGQESRLLSGVAGTDGALPTALDPQPVFQYGIPSGPPATAFNYTPIVTQLDVRLATGVAPTAITKDGELFKRSSSGSVSGFYLAAVDNYVVTTTVTNKQIQFQLGSP